MFETILSNFNFEKIMWIIKKKLAFMIIFAAIGGVLGGAYAYMTSSTIYRAKVSFYVYSDPDYVYDTSVNITNSEFTTAKNLVQSYTLILKSNTVMEKVIDTLELPYDPVTLSSSITTRVEEGTAVFYVYVYSGSPYTAMEVANAIGEIAPAEISRIVKSGGIEVIDYAELPQAPYESTNLMKFVILGLAGGFAGSAVLFVFIGLLDTTIRRKYELQAAFNIPILGEVPMILAPSRKVPAKKVINEESPFALKESYNKIRANMLYTGMGEKCPVYAVTSAEQHAGKTLNSVNMAISYSQLGKKVLLIDCDMRNASVGKTLEMKERDGLSQYLAGIQKKPFIVNIKENFDVLLSGEIPPNPAELLSGTAFEKLITDMKEQYDCIILDMPPVGIVADAVSVVKQVTGYILIVRSFQSKMVQEKVTVQILEQVDANISGIVFNGLDIKSKDYSYHAYGYDYHYGEKPKKRGKDKK